MPNSNPFLESALAYAARGWHVLPLKPGEKVPITTSGVNNATTDATTIRAWWAKWPTANIGISTAPSGLLVLDVDVSGEKQGKASLAAIPDIELPATLAQRTGRKGLHLVYLAPPGLEPARQINWRPGLDLIGKGYIVVSPSVITDATGQTTGTYSWIDPGATILPAPPLLASPPERPVAAPNSPNGGVSSPIQEGRRNEALFRLGCALRDQGICSLALEVALLAENRERFVPPLPDAEVLAVSASVMRTVTPTRDVAANELFAEALKTSPLDAADSAPAVALPPLIDAIAHETPPPTRTYSTNFPQLDTLLGGGLATRQVCGVIAPPSTGKSGFVGGIAQFIERQYRIPVLHISTELPTDEMMVRHAATICDFAWRDGIKGLVDRGRMQRAIAGRSIYMLSSDGVDRNDPIAQFAALALAIREAHGIAPFIVVDYVQLLARGAEGDARAKVGELTMKLRMLSQILDTAVLAVFSTSRAFYGTAKLETLRAGDDPTMYLAAAKESGDIEYDCATILYLDLDQSHEGQPKPARIVVARCRIGEVGFAGASFKGASGIWSAAPENVGTMSTAGRAAKRAEARIEDIEAAVYVALAGWSGPNPPPMKTLKEAIKGNNEFKSSVIATMVMQGKLREVPYFDALHRPQKGYERVQTPP